jgi:hypothetical protein
MAVRNAANALSVSAFRGKSNCREAGNSVRVPVGGMKGSFHRFWTILVFKLVLTNDRFVKNESPTI